MVLYWVINRFLFAIWFILCAKAQILLKLFYKLLVCRKRCHLSSEEMLFKNKILSETKSLRLKAYWKSKFILRPLRWKTLICPKIRKCNLPKTEIRRIRKNRCRNLQKDGENSLVVVLDNVRSMHNVVALELLMLLVEKLFFVALLWNHLTEKFTKQHLGATESVDWQFYENVKEAVIDLKTIGYEVVGMWTNY